jgi:hypothetical protein
MKWFFVSLTEINRMCFEMDPKDRPSFSVVVQRLQLLSSEGSNEGVVASDGTSTSTGETVVSQDDNYQNVGEPQPKDLYENQIPVVKHPPPVITHHAPFRRTQRNEHYSSF